MQAHIHEGYRALVISVVHEVEELLVTYYLIVVLLQLFDLHQSNAVVPESNAQSQLLGADFQTAYFRHLAIRHFPTLGHLSSILVLKVLFALFLLEPKGEVPQVGAENKTLAEHSELADGQLELRLVEHIHIVFLDFEIVSNRPHDEQLSPVGPDQDLILVEPLVDGEVPVFWQLLHILARLKRVVFNLVQPKQVLAAHRH